MNEIIKLGNLEAIKPAEGYVLKANAKFSKQTPPVDEVVVEGRKYTRHYKFEAKYVKNYGFFERFGRGFLGVFCFIGTFGGLLCSDFKTIQKLFTKKTKSSQIFARVHKLEPKPDATPSTTSGEKSPIGLSVSKGPSIDDGTGVNSSESSQSSAAAPDGVDEAVQREYDQLCLTWAANSALLEQFKKDISELTASSKWNETYAHHIINELLAIQTNGAIQKAEGIVQNLASKGSTALEQMQKLPLSIKQTIDESKAQLDFLVGIWKSENKPVVSKVGFSNVGNSCYINSTLQPLLAVENFHKLIPEMLVKGKNETIRHFEGRQQVLTALKQFMDEYRNPMRTPASLGARIGQLRHTVLKVGIEEFKFERGETGMYDAGDFYELMMAVLGLTYTVRLKTVPYLADGTEAISQSDPQLIPTNVFQLKAPGNVSEKVKAAGDSPVEDHKGDPWIVTNPNPPFNDVPAARKQDTIKIMETPPPIFIVNVTTLNEIVREGAKEFELLRYVVDLKNDEVVDFAPLFARTFTKGDATYRLVGFSQNHNQSHWTSVVRDGDHWNYCNDSVVTAVSPEDAQFKIPANYLVYQRVR